MDEQNQKKFSVFVLMPFRPEFNELYSQIIKPSIEGRKKNVICKRADEIFGPRVIIKDIWREIKRSDFIVADITNRNPNVLYELGLAHAINKIVILITQLMDDVPFDLKHIRCIKYESTVRGKKDLGTQLRSTASSLTKEFINDEDLSEYLFLPKYKPMKIDLAENEYSKVIAGLDPVNINEKYIILKNIEKNIENIDLEKDIAAVKIVYSALFDDFEEIRLTALNILAKCDLNTKLHHIRSLIDDPITEIRIKTLEIIKESKDLQSLPALLRRGKQHIDEIEKLKIVDTLGELGDEKAHHFLREIVIDDANPSYLRSATIHSLSKIIVNGDLVETLYPLIGDSSPEVRKAIADVFEEINYVTPSNKDQYEESLIQLANDNIEKIKNQAIKDIGLDSRYEGNIERKILWDLLQDSSPSIIDEFLLNMDGYIGPFMEIDVQPLLSLANKYPKELTHSIIFALKDIRSKDALNFMIENFQVDSEDVLWVLDYFARNPDDKVMDELLQVFNSNQEITHMLLASIGLAKLGDKSAEKFLVKNFEKGYDWIQDIGRDYLGSIKDRFKGKQRTEVMKILEKENVN